MAADRLPVMLFEGGGAAGQPMLLAVLLTALALMALEYLVGRLTRADTHDAGETVASLVIAVGHRLINAATVGLIALPVSWVYRHRLFDVPLDSPWALALLFLGVEFCYYWHHVAMHKVSWFWAAHGVHHSASKLNLTAAVRLGWGAQLTGGFLFYLPLVWIGFAPAAVFSMLALGLVYQFFLHVARPPQFGPLEWLLNTPRHHHVHHASNEACLDRNFGGVLILFDRLFGSFAAAPADEPLRFGLKGVDAPTRQPLTIVFAGWLVLISRLRAATSWRQRATALFGPP